MELSQIIPHIEALIFASDKPLTNMDLVELLNNALGFIDNRATADQVDAAVEGIREKYKGEFYAFELRQSGGGWQFLTKKEYHPTIAQLNGDKFLKRLSTAALETLAIIAYKQPVTKSEIEAIRGVNCDYAVQKLLEKDLVVIAGRNEEAVGKPLIYTTSKSFMDYFGINSTDDLPKINEVMMEELVKATVLNNAPTGEPENADAQLLEGGLAVTENGDIVESIPPAEGATGGAAGQRSVPDQPADGSADPENTADNANDQKQDDKEDKQDGETADPENTGDNANGQKQDDKEDKQDGETADPAS